MAGKGTLESLAILGLVKTMSDQFVMQADMTPALIDIIDGINCNIDKAFMLWPDQLSQRDVLRINCKLVGLSDMIPMDHETTITVFTSFALATLEDFAKKLQTHKRIAIANIISAVLRLHIYFLNHESDDFIDNKCGATAADAWEEVNIK